MHVAFLGVGSTGKSTLSKAVADRLGLPHIPEQLEVAMQMCRDESLFRDYDIRYLSSVETVLFQKRMFQAVDQSELGWTSFVADSAQLTQSVHVLSQCLHVLIPSYAAELVERGIHHTVTHYDIVFYLPYGAIPTVDDNRRVTNPMLLLQQDAILRRLIGTARKRGANIHTVAVTDLEQRIEYVCQKVKLLK